VNGTDGADAETAALEERVEDIENKLVINSGSGDIVDITSLVVTDSSNSLRLVSNLFDGKSFTSMALVKDTSDSTGVGFIELDIGAVVGVGGFIMQPNGSATYRFPRDTRLFSGTSSSGPWTQIGMSILAASPSNNTKIAVTFPPRSGRYFRVVFTDTAADVDLVEVAQFKFIAAAIDVLENINTRITQLETAETVDPALEAYVGALDARVEGNSDAIGILQDVDARVEGIENKLGLTRDIVDTTSLVVTDSTPLRPQFSVYSMFDGNSNSRMIITTDFTGVAFIELDMGAVVKVGGFIMQPSDFFIENNVNYSLNRFPRDTRLFSGTSSSGPWTQIGMSILAASPSNTNEISVTFPPRSGRYFRVVLTETVDEYEYVELTQFKFIAAAIDVLENINTRITQLETAETVDPALEAYVGAIDAFVEGNSAAIAVLQVSLGLTASHVTENLALYFDPSIAKSYNGGTTLFDLSGNGRDCTLEGGAVVTDDVVVLNGDPQYISTTYMPNLDNFMEYTFELWFWDNSPGLTTGGATDLISNYGANETCSAINIASNGHVLMQEGNSASQYGNFYGPSIVTGEWVHVVSSATATQRILYINGVQVGSVGRLGGVVTSSRLVIGGGSLGRFQTCKLGPVRIYYDKALTSAEVTQNYNAKNPENPDKLNINQILENKYAQLNTLVTITANNVQSVISAQNSIRDRLYALENVP